nr:MAG TPA: hypothetical protein [Caudoviricetes sp.]
MCNGAPLHRTSGWSLHWETGFPWNVPAEQALYVFSTHGISSTCICSPNSNTGSER